MLAEILSKYKAGSSLFITVVFSLSCLIWQSNLMARSFSHAVDILDFFTGTFSSFGGGVSRLFDSYASYESLKTERDLLRNQLKQNQDASLQLIRLKDENENLRNLLELKIPAEYPTVQAEVISQDPDNWFRTIIIDKGKKDGIEPYMAVLAVQSHINNNGTQKSEELVQGVVGKVIQVNRNSSRILPILDQYSRLGVRLKKSGHWALLIGQSPHHDTPQLEYMSLNIFLNKGDLLVTSGGDGIFPRGVPVGIVEGKVERLGGFQNASVKTIIDFRRLEYVSILLKKPVTDMLQFAPLNNENIPPPRVNRPETTGKKIEKVNSLAPEKKDSIKVEP